MAKQNMNFMAAYKKYNSNSKLLTNDLKILLQRIQQPTDSPIQKTMKVTMLQFDKRHQRLDTLLLPHHIDFDGDDNQNDEEYDHNTTNSSDLAVRSTIKEDNTTNIGDLAVGSPTGKTYKL
jgi:hypothetical protein